MSAHKSWQVTLFALLVVSLVIAGCAPAAPAPAAQAPTAAQAPANTPVSQKPAGGAAPADLRIAVVFNTPLEEPWDAAMMASFERVQKAKPHDLNITVDHTENVNGDDAERVFRSYAETGKYQIIWAASAYPDQLKKLKDAYPKILWVATGAGYEDMGGGGNLYWIYMHIHEAAYLLGMTAGLMTQSNVIGVVAAYPYASVNDSINGYIDGAKAVNPKVKAKVTYIESWFDPAKAKEATYAQIASGADYIYAERYGPFEAAAQKKVFAFGHYTDQNSQSPYVVVSSTIARWDPDINTIVDAWWKHATEGATYNAPKEAIWFGMKDGGSDIAPFHGFEGKLPKDIVEKVNKAKADIVSGTLKVQLKVDPVKSD